MSGATYTGPPGLILGPTELPLEHLANELAMKILSPSEIAQRFSTSLEVIWELLQRPEYYRLVKQRQAAWMSSSNTAARARLLAQTTKIEALPYMYGIISDPKAPVQSRVDAYKAIEKGAEEPAAQAGAAGAQGFQVVINLGGEQSMTLSAPMPTTFLPKEGVIEADDAE